MPLMFLRFEKNKSIFCFLTVCLLMMMFKSQRLFFTWGIPALVITLLGIISSVCFITYHHKKYRYVSRYDLVLSFFLVIILFYEFVTITETTFSALLYLLGVAIVSVFLVLTDVAVKKELFKYISITIQVLVGISLVGWVLFLIGIPLPHYYSTADVYYTHTVYYFFLLNGLPEEQIVPRFAGLFLEPGHLGTMCCFLLHFGRYNLRKIGNVILLLGVLFSLSLAAYGLLVGGVMMYIYLNIRRGVIYVLSFVVFLLSVWGISNMYNSGDNYLYKMIFERLVFEDGEMAGANRTSNFFDAQFDRYLTTEKVWLGTGKEAFETKAEANMTVGCAGWKRYFFLRGYIGSGLLLLFLSLYFFKYRSLQALSFFIIYLVANAIRDYPLKELWLFVFILAIPVLTCNFKESR